MKYFMFFINSAKQRLIYRSQLFLEFLTNGIVFAASVFLWLGVFSGQGNVLAYTETQIILYFLFSVFSGLIFSFEPCFSLGNAVQSGMLSVDLLRPISYFSMGLSKQLGSKIIYIVLATLGIFIFNQTPIFILLYTFTAFLMFYAFMSLISLIGFILENTWPLRPVLSALFLLLGGKLFPLDILPNGIYQLLLYNPFSLVGYVFSKGILGAYSFRELLFFCMVNLFYALIFHFVYQLGFKALFYRYEGVRA